MSEVLVLKSECEVMTMMTMMARNRLLPYTCCNLMVNPPVCRWDYASGYERVEYLRSKAPLRAWEGQIYTRSSSHEKLHLFLQMLDNELDFLVNDAVKMADIVLRHPSQAFSFISSQSTPANLRSAQSQRTK